ncbi:MAG: hypothetical protein U0T33_11340 [Bacteroidales bacterium]
MKNSILKYILLVVLGLAILWILFRDHVPFGRDNTNFAVGEKVNITRIELLQGDKKIVLRKSGEDWTVNDGIQARKTAVIFLLRTLREIKIKSPVSSEAFRSEISDKKSEPVRVTVYSRSRPVKSYYVYKTGSNNYGNVMKMRISSKPYIVSIPGYEENIGSHYVTDENFWRPFTVFSVLPSGIAAVSTVFLSDPSSGFRITRHGQEFTLDSNGPGEKPDSIKVRRYITYFTSVSFEAWPMLPADKEKEISASQPMCRIEVSKSDGKSIILSVWERKSDDGAKDTDRVWGQLNDGRGVFVMRYFDLDPVLRKRSYFLAH